MFPLWFPSCIESKTPRRSARSVVSTASCIVFPAGSGCLSRSLPLPNSGFGGVCGHVGALAPAEVLRRVRGGPYSGLEVSSPSQCSGRCTPVGSLVLLLPFAALSCSCLRSWAPVRVASCSWTRRRAAATTMPDAVSPATGGAMSPVYTCPSCKARYHGQQRCYDCNQPCTRIGLGGLCPACQAPVAFTDLLDTPATPHQPPNSKINK